MKLLLQAEHPGAALRRDRVSGFDVVVQRGAALVERPEGYKHKIGMVVEDPPAEQLRALKGAEADHTEVQDLGIRERRFEARRIRLVPADAGPEGAGIAEHRDA